MGRKLNDNPRNIPNQSVSRSVSCPRSPSLPALAEENEVEQGGGQNPAQPN